MYSCLGTSSTIFCSAGAVIVLMLGTYHRDSAANPRVSGFVRVPPGTGSAYAERPHRVGVGGTAAGVSCTSEESSMKRLLTPVC
jgi:hypothetical protein